MYLHRHIFFTKYDASMRRRIRFHSANVCLPTWSSKSNWNRNFPIPNIHPLTFLLHIDRVPITSWLLWSLLWRIVKIRYKTFTLPTSSWKWWKAFTFTTSVSSLTLSCSHYLCFPTLYLKYCFPEHNCHDPNKKIVRNLF